MAINPAPIQERTTADNGLFPQVWIRWFEDVCNAITANNFANIETITENTTLGKEDSTILCDATAGVFTVTLPDVLDFSGYKYNIKKVDVGANDVTVDGNGANIDGTGTKLLSGAGYPSMAVHSDGIKWSEL